MPFKQQSVNQKRPYDARWQRLRAQTLRSEPICRLCLAAGKTVPATVVDHIVPIADGGKNDTPNLMPLCARCHNGIKTPSDIAHRKRVASALVTLRAVWLGGEAKACVDYREMRRSLAKHSMQDAHTITLASIEGILIARAGGSLPPCDITIAIDDAKWVIAMGEKYKCAVIVDAEWDDVGSSKGSMQLELDYLRSRLGLEYQARHRLQSNISTIG